MAEHQTCATGAAEASATVKMLKVLKQKKSLCFSPRGFCTAVLFLKKGRWKSSKEKRPELCVIFWEFFIIISIIVVLIVAFLFTIYSVLFILII